MTWWELLLYALFRRRPKPPPVVQPPPADFVAELLALHNDEREAHGLKPLVLHPALTDTAQSHADWMSANRTMTHFPPQGTPSQRAASFGYRGSVGENIAWNQTTAKMVFEDWMNSTGHRSNILNVRWREVGFGVQDATPSDPYDKYWCVVFGAR